MEGEHDEAYEDVEMDPHIVGASDLAIRAG
jgi:hypothetical protein